MKGRQLGAGEKEAFWLSAILFFSYGLRDESREA
jgi:hypothetical protein